MSRMLVRKTLQMYSHHYGSQRAAYLLQRMLSLSVFHGKESCLNGFKPVLCHSQKCFSSLTLNTSGGSIGHNNNCLKNLYKQSSLSRVTGNVNFHTTGHVASNTDNNDDHNKSKTSGERNEKSANNSETDSLLETWFYEVCPYGTLTASIPFKTVIKPLNPQDYPDMNKVIIQLHYDTPEVDLPPSHQLAQISGLYDLNVTFDEDRANMNLYCNLIKGLDLPVSCTLLVPLKFGLTLKMKGEKDLHVEKMESDAIVIEMESGDCELHSIKSGSVSVVSKDGNIISNSTLLGNTILYTGSSGGIFMEKIQGSCVTCKTEMGPLTVRSLYTDSATFKTVFGNIHLGQCHGQLNILGENGDVKIDSLDGDLDLALQNGSVTVLLSRHNRVDIDISTGDIGLSFPEGVSTNLNLNCPTLNVRDNVNAQFEETELPLHREGVIGQPNVSQVNARTMAGTISLRILDWIESTRLAFKKEE